MITDLSVRTNRGFVTTDGGTKPDATPCAQKQVSDLLDDIFDVCVVLPISIMRITREEVPLPASTGGLQRPMTAVFHEAGPIVTAAGKGSKCNQEPSSPPSEKTEP